MCLSWRSIGTKCAYWLYYSASSSLCSCCSCTLISGSSRPRGSTRALSSVTLGRPWPIQMSTWNMPRSIRLPLSWVRDMGSISAIANLTQNFHSKCQRMIFATNTSMDSSFSVFSEMLFQYLSLFWTLSSELPRSKQLTWLDLTRKLRWLWKSWPHVSTPCLWTLPWSNFFPAPTLRRPFFGGYPLETITMTLYQLGMWWLELPCRQLWWSQHSCPMSLSESDISQSKLLFSRIGVSNGRTRWLPKCSQFSNI